MQQLLFGTICYSQLAQKQKHGDLVKKYHALQFRNHIYLQRKTQIKLNIFN